MCVLSAVTVAARAPPKAPIELSSEERNAPMLCCSLLAATALTALPAAVWQQEGQSVIDWSSACLSAVVRPRRGPHGAVHRTARQNPEESRADGQLLVRPPVSAHCGTTARTSRTS